MSKKRTYNDNFLNFGFTAIVNNGVQMPQCVICKKTLANESMKPSKLKEHLIKVHPELASKDLSYFTIKNQQLKRSRLDHETGILFQDSKIVEASYKISLLIAKQKKPHTIGEKLVKPCMLEAARLVLDQNCVNKLNKISLSDKTVKRRIDNMSQDIKLQVVEKIRQSPFFAIQLDETTDVSQVSQLLVYTWFVSGNKMEEEFLFCKPLMLTTKAEDVMNIVSKFFQEENISWEKLIGVCTDRAPGMLGSKSRDVTLVKKKNPAVITTHCMIHRESLASKTLPAALEHTFATVIRIVNHIKGGALNTRLFRQLCQDMNSSHKDLLYYTFVRWLSKGNVLLHVFELFDELQVYLTAQGKKTEHFLKDIEVSFKYNLAYLADMFEALNELNRQLQGPDTTILMHSDSIKVFRDKIALWVRKVERGNITSFKRLNEVVGEEPFAEELQQRIIEHLSSLEQKFRHYYRDMDVNENIKLKHARNPFRCNVDDLPDDIQEECLELVNNTAAKEEFQEQQQFSNSNCWVKMISAFPKMSKFALKVLIPFSSTYLCESGFSTLLEIKSKRRNRLD